MYPYLEEGLGRERIAQLRSEAERERLARSIPREPRGRVRVALGERLVRLGVRLAGAEAVRPATVRVTGE